MRVHQVAKGTMPMTNIKPGLSPATRGGLRQPVRSIRTTKTPLWLREYRAEAGRNYAPTFRCKYR